MPSNDPPPALLTIGLSLLVVFVALSPSAAPVVRAADANCTLIATLANCTNNTSCEWVNSTSSCRVKSSNSTANTTTAAPTTTATPVTTTPTPTVACSSFDQQQTCVNTSGCEWTNSSATSGRYCGVKGSSVTTPAPNTTTAPNSTTLAPTTTTAAPVSCDSYTNVTVCSAASGCTWSAARSMCVAGTSAPSSNATATPSSNSTATPSSNATATPSSNATATPGSNATATPSPKPTSAPSINTTATPVTTTAPVNCSTITSNATCISSGCDWTQPAAMQGSFCQPRGAATPLPTVACSFDQQQTCVNASGCQWTNSSATSGRYCIVKGSNITTPAPNTTLAPPPTTAPVFCDSYTNVTVCNAASGCTWSAARSMCVPGSSNATAAPSSNITLAPGNATSGPSSNTTAAPMSPKPVNCSTITYNVTCVSSGCQWTMVGVTEGYYCRVPQPATNGTSAPGCANITTPALCVLPAECEWYIGVAGSYCRKKEGCAALNATACRLVPQQCAWDSTANACSAVSNSTNAPPPLSCDTISVANCQLYPQCNAENSTSSTGLIIPKCVLRACGSYDAKACPTRCSLDTQASRCLPPPCWNYTNADTCRNNTFGACYWLANANRSGCFPVTCDAIRYDQRACDYSPRCRWSALEQTCNALTCDAANCFGDFCAWVSPSSSVANSGAAVCAEKTCGAYGAYVCPPDRCVLNDQLQCADAPCKVLSADRCSARNDCMWVLGSATATATTGTCSPKPCPYYTDPLSCNAARCAWSDDQGLCSFLSCNVFTPPNFTSSQCDAYPVCRPNQATDVPALKCIPRECGYRSVDACTAPCQWNRATSMCDALLCLNYTTAASCPSSQCAWMSQSGLCVTRACTWATNSSQCAQVPACGWIDAIGMCLDVAFPLALSCNKATSSALCTRVPQPQGRCSWVSVGGNANSSGSGSNASSSAQSGTSSTGYCAPTTVAVECYQVPVGSACPSNCVNVFGYCLNPICAKLTTNETCRQGKCQWNGSICNDPRANVLPCAAYSPQLCPGRCWSNATVCLDSKPTTGGDGGNGGAPPSCRQIGDIATCMKQDTCWYNQSSGACQQRPCALYSGADACPADRCRYFSSACLDPCPATLPVFCPQLGTCAASSSLCVGCSSSQAQCWDGSCMASLAACSCPPERSVKCGNGNCVANQSRCDLDCPSGSVRCWNNECATSSDACPCPVTKPNQCNVSGKLYCVADLSVCDDACPSLTPFKCWDGSCARNSVSCSCNPQTVRCETDYNCYPSLMQCPCKPVSTAGSNATVVPTRCSDLTCRLNCSVAPASATPVPTRVCNGKTGYQCPDGSCAENLYACSNTCSGAGGEMPSVAILATGGTFLATEWFRLQANLSYVVCGVQRATTLAVSWTAFVPTTGAGVVVGTASQVTGTSLAIAPGIFVAGTTYAFVVVAKIPGLEFSASATVTLTAVAPTPVLTFIGGDRVAPEGALSLGVNVLDKAATDSDRRGYFWICSKDGGLSTCSDAVNAALGAANSNYVSLSSVPAGNYTFTCFYKGLNVSAAVNVLPGERPAVQIIQQAARYYAGQPARLYAIARYSLPVTMTWRVNNVVLSGQTSSVAVIPGTFLPPGGAATVTVIATDQNGVNGQATLVLVADAAVVGSCRLSIASGALADGTASALASVIHADASFNATDSLEYRFSYIDYDATGLEVEVVLSSFWSALPYLEFTAPVLRANVDRNATIVATARRQGGTEVWATRCSTMVRAAVTATVARAAQNTAALLAQAVLTNDTTTAVSAARTAARALVAGVADSAVAKSVAQSVVDGLASAAQQSAASMSSTDRGSAVLAVQSALAANDANATQAQQFISDNAGKIVAMVKSVLKTSGDGALDPTTAGNATLDCVSRALTGAGTAVSGLADAVADLAKLTAQSAQLGQRTTLTTTGIKVQGEARSAADVGGRGFGAENGSCVFPPTFTLTGANETSVVQVASAQYSANPVGEAGKPAGTQLATAVAEFHVQVDGQDQPIVNQNPPLQLSFKVSDTVNVTANSTFQCRYLDNATQAWVSTGVVFDRYDAATRKVYCNTTHLSTFGAFSDNSAVTPAPASPVTPSPPAVTPNPQAATPSPASPGATPSPISPEATPSPGGKEETGGTESPVVAAAPPESDSTATTGAIIGGAIGGVVLIAIITLVIIKSRGGKDREELDLGQPMNELRVPNALADRPPQMSPPHAVHSNGPRVANDEDVL